MNRFPRNKQIMMSLSFKKDDAGTTQGNEFPEFHRNGYLYLHRCTPMLSPIYTSCSSD